MKHDVDTYYKWITAILEDGKGVTEWEENFTASVQVQLDRFGTLSPKQEEILERIYAEKTP